MARVLVLGAYGLIGSSVTRALLARGHELRGLGRDAGVAQRVLPGIDWVIRDMADLRTVDDWRLLLVDIDLVINCAGALQDGAKDNLSLVHAEAIEALAGACGKTDTGLIQISAAGASLDASTRFFRSKALGDAAIRSSVCRWWIFRPGLVVAQSAYGGTVLLRMLAAVPMIQPMAMGDALIQTVAVQEVAQAVTLAVEGDLPAGTECDLVETTAHPLRDIVAMHRRWLGFAPARVEIAAPAWLLRLTAVVADGLGRLGWRSPLRSTSMAVLRDGVRGDPKPWAAMQGPVASLEETLRDLPVGGEHRLQARVGLLMPIFVATLAVFWIASGMIGIGSVDLAAQHLTAMGWSSELAVASVVFWALVDLALGAAVLVRRWARRACEAMLLVSLIYLVSASVVTPHLWLDPLGPLVKVLPAMGLALGTRFMLDTR